MTLYDIFVSIVLIPLIVFFGIYFSYKLKCIHILHLPKVFSIFKKSHKQINNDNMSSIAALSTILGGNLGTGNISGVAVALTTGGPGALFWMSVIILITSVIKYISCFLGIKYRVRDKIGNYVGGPMYYIASPALSSLFAVLLIISTVTVGNLVQVNSLILPIMDSGVPPVFYGVVLAILILLVTIGGMHWFAEIITKIVPLMAVIYLSACIYILISYYQSIMPALALIFNSAFDIYTVSGGVIGYGVLHFISVIRVGFSRGVFATDIGLGLEAIVHSNVPNEKNDDSFIVEQSIISVLSPFIVMIVCIITGLVLIVTDVWDVGLESTNMCFAAFNIGINYYNIAGYIMLLVLFCFAFTTMLTWLFCANKAIEYLAPNNNYVMVAWKSLFIVLVPIGSVMNVTMLWGIADIAILLMLLINLYALFQLSGKSMIDEILRNNKAMKC